MQILDEVKFEEEIVLEADGDDDQPLPTKKCGIGAAADDSDDDLSNDSSVDIWWWIEFRFIRIELNRRTKGERLWIENKN